MLVYRPMQSTSLQIPSTPVTATSRTYNRVEPSYQPLSSSPLRPSPTTPDDSPSTARRRSQFKSRTPSTPSALSSRQNARVIGSSGGSVFGSGGAMIPPPLDPRKAFLREKFKMRCFERAAKARDKAIKGRRFMSEASSDGFDEPMDDEEDEDEDAVMTDELFRRIMANANRKHRHTYRVLYADEVGSSFDPDIENVDEWEQELSVSGSGPSRSAYGVSQNPEELTPADLDDEELEAYAEECAERAALADFEDIPQEELFSHSDVEDLTSTPSHGYEQNDEDVEMMN